MQRDNERIVKGEQPRQVESSSKVSDGVGKFVRENAFRRHKTSGEASELNTVSVTFTRHASNDNADVKHAIHNTTKYKAIIANILRL